MQFIFASSSMLVELIELVVAERECCSFFSFTLNVDAARATFEVTAPPEGVAVLAEVFGRRPEPSAR